MVTGWPLSVLTILVTISTASTLKTCPPCGDTHIPHPLSTGDDCGEPNYKLSCENDVLSLPALGGTSYMVISINTTSKTLVLGTPPLEPSACRTTDLPAGGLRLDESSPFSMTKRNTVMLLRCRRAMMHSAFNCSSSSLCRKFLRVVGAEGCKHKLCCTYSTRDLAVDSREIRVGEEGCAAYTSLWGEFDPSGSPMTDWLYGMEMQWKPPTRLHHGHFESS